MAKKPKPQTEGADLIMMFESFFYINMDMFHGHYSRKKEALQSRWGEEAKKMIFILGCVVQKFNS